MGGQCHALLELPPSNAAAAASTHPSWLSARELGLAGSPLQWCRGRETRSCLPACRMQHTTASGMIPTAAADQRNKKCIRGRGSSLSY